MNNDAIKELQSKMKRLDSKAALAERKIIYLNIAIESDNHMSIATRAQLKAIAHDFDREMKDLRKQVKEMDEHIHKTGI